MRGKRGDDAPRERRAACPKGGRRSSVRLRAASIADAALLARLVRPRNVWRNLAYAGPPTAADVREVLCAGDLFVWVIEAARLRRPLGVLVVYGEPGPGAHVEFDIAITRRADRKRGFAVDAVRAFEDLMFGEFRCSEVGAWIDASNHACLELVRARGWPILERRERAGQMADGVVDVVVIALDARGWRRLRKRDAADASRAVETRRHSKRAVTGRKSNAKR
jgi:RimJ/RimL family protein N-acetyltransferase